MKNKTVLLLIATLSFSSAKPVSPDTIQKVSVCAISFAAATVGVYLLARKKTSSGWETFANNTAGLVCLVGSGAAMFCATQLWKDELIR